MFVSVIKFVNVLDIVMNYEQHIRHSQYTDTNATSVNVNGVVWNPAVFNIPNTVATPRTTRLVLGFF